MARNSVYPLELATFASASLTANYQAINASGFEIAPFLVRIVNSGDTDITISYDGSTDHDYVRAESQADINVQQNSQPPNWVCKFKQGTVVYVKGTAGTGTIALAAYGQQIT